jgi:hypothetical protein
VTNGQRDVLDDAFRLVALSAAGITGPTWRPAGFSPVNGAPSPARCTRTAVSKKSTVGHLTRREAEASDLDCPVERLAHLDPAVSVRVRQSVPSA